MTAYERCRLHGTRWGPSSEEQKLLDVFGGSPTCFARIAGLAALVRLTEMDNIHIASNTTPSSVVVSVALVLESDALRSPQRLETAVYCGVEVLVRIGKAFAGSSWTLDMRWGLPRPVRGG